MSILNLTYLLTFGGAAIGIIYGLILTWKVLKAPAGNAKMQEIAAAIQQGASAYLNRQYKTVGVIAVIVAIILYFALGWKTSVGFLVGAILSASAGYIGMNVSVRANVRTAESAREGLSSALGFAFRGGAVTGLFVVSLGLLGVGSMYFIFHDVNALIVQQHCNAEYLFQ